MKKRLLLGILIVWNFSGQCVAQDLFVNGAPAEILTLAPVPAQRTVGGYPVLNLGLPMQFGLSKTHPSGNATPPVVLTDLNLVHIADQKLVVVMYVQANLSEHMMLGNWTDEPCKRDDMLWKSSNGGKFSRINCASINNVVNYYGAPTGEYAVFRDRLRQDGVDVPFTVIRATFTRFDDRGRRLIYQVDVNPEAYGFAKSPETNWASSGWNKAFVNQDKRKSDFVQAVAQWATDVQSRMDAAFNKDVSAFANLRPLNSYLPKP